MREARLIETTELEPAEIVVGTRLRPVSRAGVDALKASYEELGLIKDEIMVRKVKHKGGQLVLIAGLHRLELARELGIKVPAKIFDCTDVWAQLAEVDDNLAGAELNTLDTAVFLAERKRLYEAEHPEMAQGGFRGNQHTGNLVPDIVSFTTATAEKFGVTERHVRRMVTAGEALQPAEVALLRKAPKPVTFQDLGEIAKIEEPAERHTVCEMMASGDYKKVGAARKALTDVGGEKAAKDPIEEAFKDLLTRFNRAPKEARRRFVESAREELDELLAETMFSDGENVVALNG